MFYLADKEQGLQQERTCREFGGQCSPSEKFLGGLPLNRIIDLDLHSKN